MTGVVTYKAFRFSAVCVCFIALLVLQAFGNPNGRTLIVAIDRAAYAASEMELLEEQVREAAQSQSSGIRVSGLGDTTITIRDPANVEGFIKAVQLQFAETRQFGVSKVPALSIRIL